MMANVGSYPPAPQGVAKPRVGVPPWKVTTAAGFSGGGDLNDLAADQMTTLLYKTGRFDVIERTQLKKLLDEQNMEGIVKPGELAKPGVVRGVDYLLIGRVTNLRVKREDTRKGANLGGIGGAFSSFGFDKKDTVITSECGVDIRLVDPSSGKVMVAENSEFKRTDSASGMGVSILGGHAEGDANVSLSEDDKGKILRLALDDAVRKSLPDIDAFLRNQPAHSESPSPVRTPSAVSSPDAAQPTAGKKFCPNCGHEVTAGAKFCPSCGKGI
jgi:curli biogenesis system outer membrane secretion channel CsgG